MFIRVRRNFDIFYSGTTESGTLFKYGLWSFTIKVFVIYSILVLHGNNNFRKTETQKFL